jgi:surfactin synthase thioesterase subunit
MNKPQLILIPHAGGSRYSFNSMFPFMSDFNVVALELPGRGSRIREQLLVDFEAASSDLYQKVIDRYDGGEMIIYGHSLGSYLGLQITVMLEKAGIGPACLVVSGNPGPGISSRKFRYLMSDDQLIGEIKNMGGIQDDFFESKELLEFYLPIIRADFEIAEMNDLEATHCVAAPIYAIMGNKEHEVEHIRNWSRFTKSNFDHIVFDGGHFFMNEYPKETAEYITSRYHRVMLSSKI